jgi:signal peptidase I
LLDFLRGPIGVALAVILVLAIAWVVLSPDRAVRTQRTRSVLDVVGTLVIAGLVAFVVQLWVIKPYRVPSPSMVRTLRVDDRVIAARFWFRFNDPARGEIIVFHPNGTGDQAQQTDHVASVTFVKRLIGMPGEWIQARGGHVQVCQAPPPKQCRTLKEPYVSSPQENFGPIHIPKDRYFMMGDNRANSDDSRVWGPVRKSQLIGRVFMIYWPLTRIAFF